MIVLRSSGYVDETSPLSNYELNYTEPQVVPYSCTLHSLNKLSNYELNYTEPQVSIINLPCAWLRCTTAPACSLKFDMLAES
jgi:hypothetical protein